MKCEICGAFEENLERVEVEGAILNLCKDCAKYGKPVGQFSVKNKNESKGEEFIIEDYPKVITDAMEEKGVSMEELVNNTRLSAKDLKKILKGEILPDNETALRLQRYLKIALFETDSNVYKTPKTKSEKLSFADVVDIKTKKKD